MKNGGKIGLILVVGFSVIYAALRFWHLTDSCLWFDEIFSIHAAEMNFGDLLWFVAQDLIHPPLFYVLLKLWSLAGGESLLWLRFFPLFFSILSIYPLVRFCRELKLDYTTIAVVLFFLAANGCLIKYAQEVRMYSLLMFLALVSMWLFARFLNLGKNIWILTFVNILLVYTHYFGWLVVLSEIVAIIILQRIKIRQILIMLGIVLVGFAPWIFAICKAAEINSNVGQNIGWIQKPNSMTLFQFLLDLIEPFYFQQSTNEVSTIGMITVPILVILLTALTIYLIDLKSDAKEEKKNIILLTIFVIIPILSAFAASWILPYSIWGTRHLIIVFAPFAIFSGIMLTKIKVAPIAGVLLGLNLLIFGLAFYIQVESKPRILFECAWENLAGNLDKTKPSRIYTFEDLVAYDLWFALRGAEQNFEIVKVNGIEEMQEDKAFFLPRGFDKVRTTDENGMIGDRFYVVFRDSKFNELHPPLHNLRAKGYKIGEPITFDTPGLKGILVEVQK